ncbi:hypothetical protein HMPREF9630_01888 [Peptoanaerobacter stomatis]|uniref:Flagellar operon protein TIGR03826 n=1 Tax=Peptoanaerobacter stomatis TaxID=796937 RepID=J5WUV8_9FIRM|nr:flagellar protein [Peptoanaerobacter stomatis]EHL16488.1 hypothetical protein HMPREF9630_01888 [Peptoanaerobacter stomatis]EJU24567.1 hypothetical protein HMPREF1143_1336 [Peptoanaerobacter stomatis]NWO25914.1 flagellar protein [Peptostreptococcaceae bacterium oral taxon 081]
MKIRVKPTIGKDEEFHIEDKENYTKLEMDKMYRIVRDYLYDHQGENAIKVSDDTGVPRKVIMTFLRQGKISLAENSRTWLRKCKKCGALIETGDNCIECMQKKMSQILNPEETQVKKKNISGYSTNNINAHDNSYGRRIRKK